MMKLATLITIEYLVCVMGGGLLWVFAGGAISFLAWDNAFAFPDAVQALRWFMFMGFCFGSVRCFILIKNGKFAP